jgi:hypothetical protein
MKIVSPILLALLLSACSTTAIVSATSSHLVDSYCKVPRLARLSLRGVIAKEIAPNKIIIECND